MGAPPDTPGTDSGTAVPAAVVMAGGGGGDTLETPVAGERGGFDDDDDMEEEEEPCHWPGDAVLVAAVVTPRVGSPGIVFMAVVVLLVV